jgi:hypothetical protein
MNDRKSDAVEKSQSDKFKEAARALECDDDAERFRERVGKLVKHRPVAPTTTYPPNKAGSDSTATD